MDENKGFLENLGEATAEAMTADSEFMEEIASPLPDLPVETTPEVEGSFPWKPVVAGGAVLLTLIGGGVAYVIHRKNKKKNGGKKKGRGKFPWKKSNEEDYEDDPLDCVYEEVEDYEESDEYPEKSEK